MRTHRQSSAGELDDAVEKSSAVTVVPAATRRVARLTTRAPPPFDHQCLPALRRAADATLRRGGRTPRRRSTQDSTPFSEQRGGNPEGARGRIGEPESARVVSNPRTAPARSPASTASRPRSRDRTRAPPLLSLPEQ